MSYPLTKRNLSLAMILLGCSATLAAAVETVRVDSSASAPRLLVDGRPVRARMFWGAPGSGLIPVGPQGEPITFEFSPAEDEPSRATMHFRFGTTPGTICLDDVRVVDLGTGEDVVPRQPYEQGSDDFSPALDDLAADTAKHGGHGRSKTGVRPRSNRGPPGRPQAAARRSLARLPRLSPRHARLAQRAPLSGQPLGPGPNRRGT